MHFLWDRGRIDEAEARWGEAAENQVKVRQAEAKTGCSRSRQNVRDLGKAVRKPCKFWHV